LTNFIFGPSPNSAWKWPKFVSHTGHSIARHLFVEMLQWPTRGQDVAAMHHSRLHLRGQLPCAPVAHREGARALSRTPQSPWCSPSAPSRCASRARHLGTMAMATMAGSKACCCLLLPLPRPNQEQHHLFLLPLLIWRPCISLFRRRRAPSPEPPPLLLVFAWPASLRRQWSKARRPTGAR
jgi:hypothetical protein